MSVVLWDFDGTLAERPGLWSACLMETLDEHEPGHGVSEDAVRAFLDSGFPWHVPDVEHPELCDADWGRKRRGDERRERHVGYSRSLFV